MTPAPEKAAPIPAEVLALARLASIEIGEWVVDRSRKHPRDVVADLLLADRQARPSLPDGREERQNDRDAERYRYLRDNCVRKWRSNIGAPDSLSIDYDADGHDLSAALDASLDRARARQGGNNG